MNDKEIGEIRRRVRRDRSNMTAIYGCFVNEQKEIISEFDQSLGVLPILFVMSVVSLYLTVRIVH